MESKESVYERQKIDCNCNDCGYMLRDFEKRKESLIKHEQWQFDLFNTYKNKLIKKAVFYKKVKNDLEKWDRLLTEAESLKFQFDSSTCTLNYGLCSKLNKQVSFIPNTLQLETQDCFTHRKELTQQQ